MTRITMKRFGFTLIEIIAVIAIMAILSGAAVLSLAHTASQHSFEAVQQELQQIDSLARSAARQGGHAQQIVFDLNNNAILWPQSDTGTPLTMMRLPEADQLQVRTADDTISRGQVPIDYSPLGYSQTYALGLTRKDRSDWMIVAGLSGGVFWTTSNDHVDAIFQSLEMKGLDAANGNDAH